MTHNTSITIQFIFFLVFVSFLMWHFSPFWFLVVFLWGFRTDKELEALKEKGRE